MAGINKIKAKQIDIASVEKVLEDAFIKKSNIVVDGELSEDSDGPVSGSVVYNKLQEKAPTENPTFTGTVTLPAVGEEDNTQAATVGFVLDQLEKYNANIEILDGGEI